MAMIDHGSMTGMAVLWKDDGRVFGERSRAAIRNDETGCPRQAAASLAGRRAVTMSTTYRPRVHFFDGKHWSGRQRVRAERAGLRVYPVELFAGWLVCSGDYTAHAQLQTHSGSAAEYRIDGHVVLPDGHALFAYELPPGGKTSQHAHTHPGLGGEVTSLLHGGAWIAGRPLERPTYTEPHEAHQVIAGEQGAVITAVLLGAADVPRDQWHTRLF